MDWTLEFEDVAPLWADKAKRAEYLERVRAAMKATETTTSDLAMMCGNSVGHIRAQLRGAYYDAPTLKLARAISFRLGIKP